MIGLEDKERSSPPVARDMSNSRGNQSSRTAAATRRKETRPPVSSVLQEDSSGTGMPAPEHDLHGVQRRGSPIGRRRPRHGGIGEPSPRRRYGHAGGRRQFTPESS